MSFKLAYETFHHSLSLPKNGNQQKTDQLLIHLLVQSQSSKKFYG